MQIEMRAIEAVRPYPDNPRHNQDAVEAVARSIREFGFRQPIVVDERGMIIVGHTRWLAAKTIGLTEVPVHVAIGLSPEQARAYRIADNQTATIATWDEEKLVAELMALREADFALDLTGFSADDLQRLIGSESEQGLVDEDAVPEPPDAAITQPGDLWRLGNHRLLCGDSSKPSDLDRLLGGQSIQLVNTDPPYNVKVEPRSNNAIAAGLSSFEQTHHQKLDVERHPEKAKATTAKLRAKDRPLANDFVSDEEFDRLLDAWFGNIARVLEPGRSFYIWGGYANLGNYPPFLKKHALYFSQGIVWDKEHPVLTRKDFMGAFELCQPPDTRVLTAAGTSRLSALRDSDRVVSFYTHNSSVIGLREGYPIVAGTRDYRGKLFAPVVGKQQSWCTDGHLWTVRLTRDSPKKWCVYLMRRGDWWRVGMTRMRTKWGLGLKGRLCGEHGNEGWILSLHDSHIEARLQEQWVSVQFGIPQTCWVDNYHEQRRQRQQIVEFYARFDPGQLRASCIAALQAFHRSIDYPFVRQSETRSQFGARQSIQVRACNLLPGIMEVPVPCPASHRTRSIGQRVEWRPLDTIDVQDYSGPVHSLEVTDHHHYIADGLVTHNCFYGWREGAGHHYYGPNNATDLWHVKKVNPQQMVHLTEKPVELARRALEYSSRVGDNVLDLFGGSGSTLMAAEQTDRRAFLMELDPLYCDVIVQRWEQFTGRKAVRESATIPATPPPESSPIESSAA